MLLPFLESLIGTEDVRPAIAQKYNLRGKIAAAVCPLDYHEGDPFERWEFSEVGNEDWRWIMGRGELKELCDVKPISGLSLSPDLDSN